MSMQPTQTIPSAVTVTAARGVPRRRRTLSILAVACSLVVLGGCQTWSRTPRDANLPGSVERLRTTTDIPDVSELELPIESTTDVSFMLRPMDDSDPLPAVQLRNVNVTESGLYDAMNLIAASANLSLSLEGGARGLERYGSTAVFRLSGTLTEVMEQLSEGIGFFYTVRNRMLVITPERQFILQTPPALTEDNLAGFANNLQVLGARDTYLDRLNGTVAFRANRTALRSIEGYVKQLRAARAMLIYEVHVYQVDLTDTTKSGINWNRINWSDGRPATTTTGTGTGTGTGTTPATTDFTDRTAVELSSNSGFGIGAVISGRYFSGTILMDFLRSQGTVRVVSQPRIGLMSGSRGSLQVGQNTSYVAKVGTNIGNNLNQVTVETERLTTGFELTLYGSENDGTITTDINLSVSELLRFENFTALGTNLSLPQTSDRKVQTIVAARPGDVILLGGISVGRDNADVTNAIGGNTKGTSANRGELVIAIRPKVVRFVKRPPGSPAAGVAADREAAASAGTRNVELSAEWVAPGAVKPPSDVVSLTPVAAVRPDDRGDAETNAVVSHRAQFGAYRGGEDAARAAWKTLEAAHAGLKGMQPDIVREAFGDQNLWLLRSPPMARDAVQRLCLDIRRAGDACAVIRVTQSGEGG